MRKVKNLKGYIIGGLIGATLMFSAQGFAEDGLQTISALLRTGLNVTLDGKSVTLDNPSINYNGSTYIKLRDISKITGMGVNWNDATQTVELMSSVSGAVYGNGNGTSVSGSVYGTPTTSVSSDTPSPTSPMPTNTPQVSTGDDLIFYSLNDIDDKLLSNGKSVMTTKINNSNTYALFNGNLFLTNSKNFYYNSDDNKGYFSKTFLLQLFTIDFLTGFNQYNINYETKSLIKIN